MIDSINTLRNNIKDVEHSVYYIRKILDNSIICNKENEELAKKFIQILEEQKQQLDKKLEHDIKNCTHNFQYYCSGHNDSVYMCAICGEFEYR